jgi:hypothetical protein
MPQRKSSGLLYWIHLAPNMVIEQPFGRSVVDSVSLSWDGTSAWSVDDSGGLQLLDLGTMQAASDVRLATSNISAAGIEEIISHSGARAPRESITVRLSSSQPRTIAFGDDAQHTATLEPGGQVRIWNSSGQPMWLVGGRASDKVSMAFSPNSRWIATQDRSGLRIYDLDPASSLNHACCLLQGHALRSNVDDVCARLSSSCDTRTLGVKSTSTKAFSVGRVGCADKSREVSAP